MKFGRLQNGLLRSQPETAPSNFISNPTPLKDTTGWSLYSDAAGIAPVDGTGGSVNTGTEINWSRTTSSPLSETASFLFSKIATSSMQGKGVSYDFTINRADQAKVCRIDFDYEVASGTYADGDLTVWLYDVTNAQLIQPSTSSILNAVGPQKKQSLSFQTNSNSTSYRLIIHVASTSASAYTVKFDNVSVTRESISQGTVVTDWVSYTPTGSWSTNTTYSGQWRRVGDQLEFRIRLNLAGAPTATGLTVNFLPSGLSVDTTKNNGTSTPKFIGSGSIRSAGSDSACIVAYVSGTAATIIVPNTASTYIVTSSAVSNTVPATFTSGDSVEITGSVPILGWSSSQQLSSDADTRVVAARYSTAAGQSMANGASTLIDFGTKTRDTHGAVTTGGSWKFTAPVPGIYSVSALTVLSSGGGWAAAEEAYLDVYKNGSFLTRLDRYYSDSTHTARVTLGNSDEIDLSAGDYIDIRLYQSSGAAITLLADAASNYVNVSRISGPAQIAASEVVAARIQQSSPIFLGNGIDTHFALQSTTFDTHGGYNSSTGYTVRAPGFYKVGACVQIESYSGWVVGESLRIALRKNASTDIVMALSEAVSGTQQVSLNGSALIRCNAGDVLQVYVQQISGAALNTLNTASTNWITFERLGGIG